MLDTGVITPRDLRARRSRRSSCCVRGGSTTRSASRTSSATSATSSSRRTAPRRSARAASRSTRRSSRATSGWPRQAIRDTLNEPDDPAAALISISPRTGAIRAMTAVVPNRPKNEFNLLSQARRQPGLDVQDVRARRGGRAGHQPGLDLLRLGAVHLQGAPGGQLRRRQLVVRAHVRERLLRLELDPQRDDSVGQLGLRAADPRRRPRRRSPRWRAGWACARSWT